MLELASSEVFSFARIAYLVFQSVLQVVFISLTGFWSTHAGYLPKQSQKVISLLNVNLFTPCLIYSKMARALSMARILEIAVIPLFFALTTCISYVSGKIVSTLLKLDTDESNFVIGNSIFGNSNSLPVSLTLSLAYTLPNLTWDQIPNDSRDNVASRGLLYLLIFQQIGQMLRWSWGYNKLLKWSGENTRHMPPSQVQLLLESNAQMSTSRLLVVDGENDESISSSSDRDTTPLLQQDTEESAITGVSIWKRTKNSCYSILGRIKANLNPPLYSMLLGIIVACLPSLQAELYREESFVYNTFSQAVEQVGSVSIPLILVVLGSNLYPTTENFPKTHNHNKLVLGSIIGRMILPSCLLLPIITIAVKYINVSILDDPIFLVVGFLLTVSPPAIQLTQITQLNEFFEAEMVDVLFWGYAVLSLPVSIIVVSGAIYVLQWANN